MSAATPADRRWLDAAVRYARPWLGSTAGRPLAAALVVEPQTGMLVGRAVTGPDRDCVVAALAEAGSNARGAVLFTTLEPAAEPLIEAGIRRVVVGIRDPDRSRSGIAMARLREVMIDVTLVEHAPSRALVADYAARLARGRPTVTVVLVLSADDMIAAPGGEPLAPGDVGRRWIDAQRATCGAVLSLVEASAVPDLVLDFAGGDRTVVPARNGRPDIAAAMAAADARGVDALYAEPGAKLAEALIGAGVVDRLHLVRTPAEVGRCGTSATILGTMEGRLRAALLDAVAEAELGPDTVRTYEPAP